MASTFTPAKSRGFRIATFIGVVLLVAAMSPLVVSAQYLHPKIAKQSTIRNVVILPAKVDIVRASMKGPEGMGAESELLSARVENEVAEVLAKKNVKRLNTPTSSSGDGTQQKYTAADIQARFDALLPKIMKKRGDVKKGRFSMGDEVLHLNLDKSADPTVLIRRHGRKTASGNQTF